MGEVHAGHDERLDRSVAVKLLSAELAADPQVRRRFESEARSAARVSHPHVVTIYDTGEDVVPFIVMERLPGRTLTEEIADGPFASERLRQVASEMLSALDAAHAQGVVHRDVKPGNVLLTADNRVKVSDFGIAKIIDDSGDTTGLLLGTVAYVAPERLAGEPASPRSDLFSVGVVLYEAATASKPFKGESALATLHAVATEAPISLATRRPDLDAAFVAAVERAMDKDPARRFASAAEMATALGASVAPTAYAGEAADATVSMRDTSVTAVLPLAIAPVPPHASRFRARAPHRIVAALLVLTALGTGIWFATRDDHTPAAPAPTTVAHSRSSPSSAPLTAAPTAPPTQAPKAHGKGNGKGSGNGNGD